MTPHPMLVKAVETLCARFERADYGLMPVIDLGALVANADGTVDKDEIEVLQYLFRAALGETHSAEMVRHLVQASLSVIEAAGVEARARLIAEILLDCDAVDEGLTVALAVAYASEGLAEPEKKIIATIAEAAHVAPRELDALIATVGAGMGARPVAARAT